MGSVGAPGISVSEAHEKGIQPFLLRAHQCGGCLPPLPPGRPTWDGHVPDQDRVEKAGHRQQHVCQELLEAAQPAGFFPCSVGQGLRPAPGGREFRVSRGQETTKQNPSDL